MFLCLYNTYFRFKQCLCNLFIIIRLLQIENVMVYATLLESEFIE